jgi:hypothetical protein
MDTPHKGDNDDNDDDNNNDNNKAIRREGWEKLYPHLIKTYFKE